MKTVLLLIELVGKSNSKNWDHFRKIPVLSIWHPITYYILRELRFRCMEEEAINCNTYLKSEVAHCLKIWKEGHAVILDWTGFAPLRAPFVPWFRRPWKLRLPRSNTLYLQNCGFRKCLLNYWPLRKLFQFKFLI